MWLVLEFDVVMQQDSNHNKLATPQKKVDKKATIN